LYPSRDALRAAGNITTVTASRRRLFQVHQNAELLIDTLQNQRAKDRLALRAFAVMPDQVHLILTPAPEVSLEKAMQYIKGGFSFRLKSKLDVWERSYDSRRILDPKEFAERIVYRTESRSRPHRGAGRGVLVLFSR
jgi:putative transposase